MPLQLAMSHPNFHGEVQRVMALLKDDDWLGSTTLLAFVRDESAPFNKITAFLANLALNTEIPWPKCVMTPPFRVILQTRQDRKSVV